MHEGRNIAQQCRKRNKHKVEVRIIFALRKVERWV